MDYKETLVLPATSFPMRGNLPQNEPKTYLSWAKSNLYAKMLQNRQNANTTFNLHDGPEERKQDTMKHGSGREVHSA